MHDIDRTLTELESELEMDPELEAPQDGEFKFEQPESPDEVGSIGGAVQAYGANPMVNDPGVLASGDMRRAPGSARK